MLVIAPSNSGELCVREGRKEAGHTVCRQKAMVKYCTIVQYSMERLDRDRDRDRYTEYSILYAMK